MAQHFYQDKNGDFHPVNNIPYQPYQGNKGYYPQPQQSKEYKKHSGAKYTLYQNKEGVQQYLTTGWRLNNKQLLSYKAVTTKKSILSEKGWFGSVWLTITNKITGEVNSAWGTMEKSSGKVVVDDLALVMNPRAKNGGYCGTFFNPDAPKKYKK
jgi:hypothetical protein